MRKTVSLPVLAAAGMLALAGCGSSGAPAAAPTVTVTAAAAPAPTVTVTVTAAPSKKPPPPAPPKPAGPIFSLSGSGIENSARFNVPDDWNLAWSYDCASFGTTGNFIVSEDNGGDFSGASVNELGSGGHGVTHVYNDAGAHYLSMNSECSWTVTVAAAP